MTDALKPCRSLWRDGPHLCLDGFPTTIACRGEGSKPPRCCNEEWCGDYYPDGRPPVAVVGSIRRRAQGAAPVEVTPAGEKASMFMDSPNPHSWLLTRSTFHCAAFTPSKDPE